MHPGLDRIPLDDGDMRIGESLGSGENCQGCHSQ
jgi:hypothetical protein